MKYFTSDLHFGHTNILKFCRGTRRGETAQEMNELLIKAINDTVGTHDELYMLGDTFFCNASEGIEIMSQINCLNVHHINGNHDKTLHNNHQLQKMFVSVQDYKELKIGNDNVILFHYPMLTWNKSHYGAYQLFGHEHGNIPRKNRRTMDVGVDARPDDLMKPWSWDEIKEMLQPRRNDDPEFYKKMTNGEM